MIKLKFDVRYSTCLEIVKIVPDHLEVFLAKTGALLFSISIPFVQGWEDVVVD